jgi:hypothetical protein
MRLSEHEVDCARAGFDKAMRRSAAMLAAPIRARAQKRAVRAKRRSPESGTPILRVSLLTSSSFRAVESHPVDTTKPQRLRDVNKNRVMLRMNPVLNVSRLILYMINGALGRFG